MDIGGGWTKTWGWKIFTGMSYSGTAGDSGFAFAIVGGNSTNGLLCGPWAVNLNNAASNANWNIGASIFYQVITAEMAGIISTRTMPSVLLAAWRKLTRRSGGPVAKATVR